MSDLESSAITALGEYSSGLKLPLIYERIGSCPLLSVDELVLKSYASKSDFSACSTSPWTAYVWKVLFVL